MTYPLRNTSVRSQMHRQTTGSQDTPDAVGSLIYVALDPVRQHYRNRFEETPYSLHMVLESHLFPHAASAYGIAPARLARPWILYRPSEQSRWAPQLGQRSWQACMSIIACPHMGHSFLLPADIHQAPRNRLILLILAGRCRWQLPSCPRARLRQGRRLSAWIADARCRRNFEEWRN